jgi:flagellum-specific ATP synthase
MFDTMPKLLERSGTSEAGSITGFYTILVDGDDMDEPVSDTVRGILDGHIILSRALAQAYHYPAIDVLQSISRCASDVTGPAEKRMVNYIRKNMAIYAKSENLINVGAYRAGSNPSTDEAIGKHDKIEEFLTQGVEEKAPLEDTLSAMLEIAEVEISEEEKTGPLANISAGRAAGVKEVFSARENDDAGRALNSVAALFSQAVYEEV